jgi:hypothetical protein
MRSVGFDGMVAANEHRRFFFVHVMKTGGTSFVFQLSRNFAPDEVYPDEALDRRSPTDAEPYTSITSLEQLPPERREAVRIYTGHLPLVARELMGPNLVTLTLLRDPVDRTVSVLKHFKRLWPRYRDLPLDAIYDDEVVYRHFVEGYQTRMFALTRADDTHAFASVTDYETLRAALSDPARRPAALVPGAVVTIDARRLALAKRNLASVDVLGVNEAFDAFVAELRDHYGWWPSGEQFDARAFVSSEPWIASDALRARIERDNPYDRALYDYARELIAARGRPG